MVASVRGRVSVLPPSAQCGVPLRNLLTCSDASNLSCSEAWSNWFNKKKKSPKSLLQNPVQSIKTEKTSGISFWHEEWKMSFAKPAQFSLGMVLVLRPAGPLRSNCWPLPLACQTWKSRKHAGQCSKNVPTLFSEVSLAQEEAKTRKRQRTRKKVLL